MNVNQMRTAEVLLKLHPGLVTSEETVNQLVMRDVIDFNTGLTLIAGIKSKDPTASTEGFDMAAYENGENLAAAVSFPSISESVVFNTVVELASGDEKASLMRILDELNLHFQSAFKKRKEDIIRVLSSIVEITGEDGAEASKIMEDIKKDQYVLITK